MRPKNDEREPFFFLLLSFSYSLSYSIRFPSQIQPSWLITRLKKPAGARESGAGDPLGLQRRLSHPQWFRFSVLIVALSRLLLQKRGLRAGMRGVLITCVKGKEKFAVIEAVNLFNEACGFFVSLAGAPLTPVALVCGSDV